MCVEVIYMPASCIQHKGEKLKGIYNGNISAFHLRGKTLIINGLKKISMYFIIPRVSSKKITQRNIVKMTKRMEFRTVNKKCI